MQRTFLLATITALLAVGGCSSFYPTESRIVSSNWADSPWVAQFKGDLPPDNTPVPYCYNTIGVVECHATPRGNRDNGRFVNSYTGATPRPDDPESGLVEWMTYQVESLTDFRAATNSQVDEATPDDAEQIPPATEVRKVPVKSPPTWSD